VRPSALSEKVSNEAFHGADDWRLYDLDRSILLKKSIMVSTAEKYVLEIEIFALSTGLRAQILRSCAQ
jgi:hypothetical protein